MNDDSNEKTPAKKLGGITGKGFMPGRSGNPSGRPKKRVEDHDVSANEPKAGP